MNRSICTSDDFFGADLLPKSCCQRLSGATKLFLACTKVIKLEYAYLFNNNFNLQIERTFVDPSGRFIICDVKANDKSLTLPNIYAPNAAQKVAQNYKSCRAQSTQAY